MPIDINGMNNDYVEYFPLQEYVDRITLLPNVLEHLENTNQNFKEYVKYAFVMKRYQSLINRVYSLSFIVSIIIALIVYLLTKRILISVILLVAWGILLYIIIMITGLEHKY